MHLIASSAGARTPVRHLDPRAVAAGDAQHRATGRIPAPDGLVRRGWRGHRRLRDRARRRRAAARAACRPPRTDLGAAGERHRCRNAAGRDRSAAGGRFARASWSRSRPGSGWPPPRSAPACEPNFRPFCPTPAPSAPRTPWRRRSVELTYIFGPPLALCIGALWSHRRGPCGCRRRPAGRDRGIRRPAGLTHLAAGAAWTAAAWRLAAHTGDADAGDRPDRRRRAARRRRGRRHRGRQDA